MQSGDYSDDERIDNEGSVVDDNDVEIIDGDSTVNSDNKSTPTMHFDHRSEKIGNRQEHKQEKGNSKCRK